MPIGPSAESSINHKSNQIGRGHIRAPLLLTFVTVTTIVTRMWADAQRDGRPAEHRWRPLRKSVIPFLEPCRKVWLTPAVGVQCSNAAKMENLLKFAGVPQTRQQISAVSGSKFTILSGMWGRHCCLTSFLPIVDACLSCEDIARQTCTMVRR